MESKKLRDGQADESFCDLILSIGPSCRPAINLRSNHLREFSSPLDWVGAYSLDTVLHLFRVKFNDFFTEYEVDRENPQGAPGKLRVWDTKNHIRTIHHIPENMWLSSSYPQFKEKMNTRAARLEARLQSASSIILVSEYTESKDDMSAFLRSFSDIYPHLKIKLINMRNDEEMPYDEFRQEVIFDDGILSYVEYILNDTEQGVEKAAGNTFVWSKILSKYYTPALDAIRNEWLQFRKNSEQVIIFGAGRRCVYILNWLSRIGMTIDGIAVSSMTDNPEEINRIKVKMYSSYSKDASIIISIEDKARSKQIRSKLYKQGYKNITFVDSYLKLINADE
jgi:hypothetical protein